MPGVRQFVELDPLLRRQQQDLQVQHSLAAGAGNPLSLLWAASSASNSPPDCRS